MRSPTAGVSRPPAPPAAAASTGTSRRRIRVVGPANSVKLAEAYPITLRRSFVIVLSLALVFWIWQNRTTRQRTGMYPIDSFGGYTTELAGPASLFFLLFTLVVTAFAVVLIVGHLIWGQKF